MDHKEKAEVPITTHLAPFKSRLLRIGSDGTEDFGVIQQLHPTESAVFERAINELSRRHDGDATVDADARSTLGATLSPWAMAFIRVTGTKPDEDQADWERFQEFTRPWARVQLAACCTATLANLVHDYHEHGAKPLISTDEQNILNDLDRQIDQFKDRAEANRLVTRLRERYTEILAVIESRTFGVDSTTARSFSYLLNTTSGGSLTDIATASIILRGNDSPASRVVRNPLQILDVNDVSAIFDLAGRQLTNQVSKLRNQAMKSEELSYFSPLLKPQQLWQRTMPPGGARSHQKEVR